ncbi:MAG TPA: hypothetical protein VN679_07375 [Candidatus Acidoferrales bacterium]|nr:hypothetical protein [Candidatus Acidoferrales bacterium]
MTDPQLPLEPLKERNASPVVRLEQHEATVARVLLRVLSGRATAVASVMLVFALACWAMWQPSLLRLAVAGGFALFSLVAQMLVAWAER